MTDDDESQFRNLTAVVICPEKCPGCQRICGVEEEGHVNKHKCKYGHQIRALGNVRLSNNEPSVKTCE